MSINHVHGAARDVSMPEMDGADIGSQGSSDFANVMGMSGNEILAFILGMLRQAAGQQPSQGAFDPSFNPTGMTPNEQAMGHCAGGSPGSGSHGGGGDGAHGSGHGSGHGGDHGGGAVHGDHGAGGGGGVHGSGHGSGAVHGEYGSGGEDGAHNGHGAGGSALRDPVYAERAPDDIVAGLGGLVDADGKVEAANHGQHSGHAGHEMGHELNVHATYEAASAAGIDADRFIDDFVADDSNFNPGQTDEQKYVGALTVLNDMTAAVTMGGIEGDLGEISKIAGSATNAALAGDADSLRQILTDAGGDVAHLSDDMLLNTWGTNSHMYNHAILNVNSDHFALTHLRSLNSSASDGTDPGSLGFYNDKGAWPQWGAQDDAIAFLNETLGTLPSSGERSVGAYSPSGGGAHGHH